MAWLPATSIWRLPNDAMPPTSGTVVAPRRGTPPARDAVTFAVRESHPWMQVEAVTVFP